MKLLLLSSLAAVASANCANDCSGQGLCNVFSQCECFRNWMGNDCSRRVCYFGRAFVDTPQGDLNSNGKLDTASVPSRMTNTPTFEDFPLDYADGAGTSTTWNEAHFYAECSNKGSCNRETGLCECWPGYEGSGCTRLSCPTATAETCSGHGVCRTLAGITGDGDFKYNSWDRHKTQRCVCDPGYEGIKCDQVVCPSGDDPVTKYVKLTTICLEFENDPTEAVHQGNMPIDNYASLAAARKVVYGSKSAARATLMVKSGWNKFENGAVVAHPDMSGCINVGEVSGEFVKGDKIMLADDGQALKSASHATSELIVKSISKATYTNAKQENEVQRLEFKPQYLHSHTFNVGDIKPMDTKFALQFTDEFGQSYTTRTIAGGMGAAATIQSLMNDIEAAVEELPNSVVTNVQMYMESGYTGSSPYTVACPSDGEFPKKAGVQFLSGFDSLYDNTKAVNADVTANNDNADYCDFFAIKMLFKSNSGNVPQVQVYGPATANFYTITATTVTEGSTENALCSNRGACDYTTGECKCYQGFTGHDCSKQNVLAVY